MMTKSELSNLINVLQLKNEELEKQIDLQNRIKKLEKEKVDRLRILEKEFEKLQHHWIRIYPLKNKEGIEKFGSLSKFKSEKYFTQGRMWGLQDGIRIVNDPK
jgi:hypothetical protein